MIEFVMPSSEEDILIQKYLLKERIDEIEHTKLKFLSYLINFFVVSGIILPLTRLPWNED